MIVKISDIAIVKTGLVLSRFKRRKRTDDTFEYKTLSLKSFEDFSKYNDTYAEEFLSCKEIKEEYIAKAGDVIVRLRTPSRAILIEKEYGKLIYNSLVAIVRVDEDKILPEYLAYVLNTSSVLKQMTSNVTGTQIHMINVSDINNITINLVDIAKQRKIVEYNKLAYQEVTLMENLIKEKQKLSHKILEKLISQEIK